MFKDGVWVCEICGFKTFSRVSYDSHMNRYHNIIVVETEPIPEKTTYAGYNKEQIRRFDDISFRNMVKFYEDELIQIQRGVTASEVLSRLELKNLAKKGILRVILKNGSGKVAVLSQDSKTLLGME